MAGTGSAALATIRSASSTTWVIVVELLLPGFGSSRSPETCATLVSRLPAWSAATFTTTVMVADAPMPSVPKLQIRLAKQAPWLASASTSVTPAGSASTTWVPGDSLVGVVVGHDQRVGQRACPPPPWASARRSWQCSGRWLGGVFWITVVVSVSVRVEVGSTGVVVVSDHVVGSNRPRGHVAAQRAPSPGC